MLPAQQNAFMQLCRKDTEKLASGWKQSEIAVLLPKPALDIVA